MSTEDGLKVHVCVTFDIAHEALEGMLVACDTREPMHESVRLWLYAVADNVSLLAQSTVCAGLCSSPCHFLARLYSQKVPHTPGG